MRLISTFIATALLSSTAFAQSTVIANPDGSAYISDGSSTVIVGSPSVPGTTTTTTVQTFDSTDTAAATTAKRSTRATHTTHKAKRVSHTAHKKHKAKTAHHSVKKPSTRLASNVGQSAQATTSTTTTRTTTNPATFIQGAGGSVISDDGKGQVFIQDGNSTIISSPDGSASITGNSVITAPAPPTRPELPTITR